MTTRILLLLLVASTTTGVNTASAQVAGEPPPYTLRLWGEATVTVPPDRVEIDIAVTSRADSAAAAASQNAAASARVLTDLKRLLDSPASLKTVAYSVRPEYRYPREGAKPQIAGYVAANVVRVVSPHLERAGTIVDAATTAGATRIQRLDFTLQNREAAYAEALGEAAAHARKEADALASALGVKVFRVLTAIEEPLAPVPIPLRQASFAAEDAPAAVVEPGTIDVQARVRLTVEFRSE
jgi:uncharacterized protein YggE